ncbi:hypothetical protein EON81_13105 [bacterium]|nr:MAG: hypothetical protein EON81_13105 [bacterium]
MGTDTADRQFREDFDTRYAGQSVVYSEFEPSYRYGAELQDDARFKGREYREFESELPADYEARYPHSRWDRVKDAVRAGYDQAQGNYAYADRDRAM